MGAAYGGVRRQWKLLRRGRGNVAGPAKPTTIQAVADIDTRHRGHRPRRGPRPEFRPDIEGLRAVAILVVIAFHTGGISGGFIGVDVFFVISGFLITRLLWIELDATGRIDLMRFYAARARRLVPAAATVLVLTAIASVVLLPPLQARTALDDGLASALYIGNYRLAITGTDYLAHAAPSPFQHYWSLGLEEQFYLLWPALLLGTAWLLRRRGPRPGARRGRPSALPYFSTLTVVAALSLALSVTLTHSSPPWAFFSLPTRAWELATGALVALSTNVWRRLPAALAAATGFVGLALVVWAAIELDDQTAYPGTAALMPVLGTALIIGAGCSTPIGGVGRLLAIPAMRAVGRLSYSWYLWHWPILVFAPLLVGHPIGWAGRLGAVSASFALAVLTLRYIERPVRYSRRLRRSVSRSIAAGGAITAAAVSVAVLLPMLVPAPVGHGEPATAAVASEQRASGDFLTDAIATAHRAVRYSANRSEVPGDLSPPLVDAAADKPSVFLEGCVRSWPEVGVPDCVTGGQLGGTTVALVGDSHAAMWQPALEPLAQQRNWRLITMAKVTCPLLDLAITSPYLGRTYTECGQWRTEALQRLVAERPKLVVIGMSRRYGADFGFTGYDREWVRSISALVADVRSATAARVLVLGPVPDPGTDVPVCLSGHLDDALACAPQRSAGLNTAGIAAETRATRGAGGEYADLSDLFCAATRCPAIVGSDLVYRDDNHITVSYARRLAPVLGMLAEQAIAPRS